MPTSSISKSTAPLIGAHVSAAGGAFNAVANAVAEKCETFQFFLCPPQTYRFTPPSPEATQQFLAAVKEHQFKKYYVHAPYLINLASAKAGVRQASIKLLRQLLDVGSTLGVQGVMFHPGSAASQPSKEVALATVSQSINTILKGYKGSTRLLLENAAGSGQTVGVSFGELAQIIDKVDAQDQIGVCLDTQHAFASGYNWCDAQATTDALKEFDKLIGFKRLLVVQANDSKMACGSNKDRHEHVWQGLMGKQAWKNLLHHPKLRTKPFVLETEPGGRDRDIALLKRWRTIA